MSPQKAYALFGLFLLLASSNADAASELHISAIEESDNSNISELVLREAYKKLGIEIFITPLPAKRSLHHANEGLSDGELFRIDGMAKAYTNLIQVRVPVNHLEAVVMTRKVDFKVDGWKSLAPYWIAVRRGVKFSDAGTEGMKRSHFNSNIGLGRILLEDNQIDIAVVARANGLQTIQQLEEVKASKGDLRLLEPPIEVYPLYHYLHKRHEALVAPLAKILSEMATSGRSAEIRKQYLDEK